MAEALVLDSEAVNALANPKARGTQAQRAAAILQLAYQERALVRVPAPVLAEFAVAFATIRQSTIC